MRYTRFRLARRSTRQQTYTTPIGKNLCAYHFSGRELSKRKLYILMPSHHNPTHNQRPTSPGQAGGKHPSGGQKSAGKQKPGQMAKQPPAPQTPSSGEPAPQVTKPAQTPQRITQRATTERGQPREEQAFMPKSASSTLTPQDQRHTIRSIHYSLSYTVQGEEHGTDGAVVLLHGLPGSAFSWRNITSTLAAKRGVG